MVRYHGVLAWAAKWRCQIVPRTQHTDANRDTCQLAPGPKLFVGGHLFCICSGVWQPGEGNQRFAGFLSVRGLTHTDAQQVLEKSEPRSINRLTVSGNCSVFSTQPLAISATVSP